MSTELPKTYDPASVELQAYDVWLKEGAFHAEPSDSGQPYSIVIPPPNVSRPGAGIRGPASMPGSGTPPQGGKPGSGTPSPTPPPPPKNPNP